MELYEGKVMNRRVQAEMQKEKQRSKEKREKLMQYSKSVVEAKQEKLVSRREERLKELEKDRKVISCCRRVESCSVFCPRTGSTNEPPNLNLDTNTDLGIPLDFPLVSPRTCKPACPNPCWLHLSTKWIPSGRNF